jgi:hypothetical protein
MAVLQQKPRFLMLGFVLGLFGSGVDCAKGEFITCPNPQEIQASLWEWKYKIGEEDEDGEKEDSGIYLGEIALKKSGIHWKGDWKTGNSPPLSEEPKEPNPPTFELYKTSPTVFSNRGIICKYEVTSPLQKPFTHQDPFVYMEAHKHHCTKVVQNGVPGFNCPDEIH